ncbi:hypothetical protein [Legionella sp. WA2022007384]
MIQSFYRIMMRSDVWRYTENQCSTDEWGIKAHVGLSGVTMLQITPHNIGCYLLLLR